MTALWLILALQITVIVWALGWAALDWIRRDPEAPPPPAHVHRLVLDTRPLAYASDRATVLAFQCLDCPHRDYLGVAWADASNRRTAA